ncbi:MAG: hypothetical protein P4M04_04385 [Acidobacteriota bacterium]|nr:hypothetical protein [Acidobacteriota bacterium]
MLETLLEEARGHIAESSKQSEQSKKAVNACVDEVVDKSQRAVKRGRKAAERLPRVAAIRCETPPLSVTGALVVGVLAGGLAGWVLGRRGG